MTAVSRCECARLEKIEEVDSEEEEKLSELKGEMKPPLVSRLRRWAMHFRLDSILISFFTLFTEYSERKLVHAFS